MGKKRKAVWDYMTDMGRDVMGIDMRSFNNEERITALEEKVKGLADTPKIGCLPPEEDNSIYKAWPSEPLIKFHDEKRVKRLALLRAELSTVEDMYNVSCDFNDFTGILQYGDRIKVLILEINRLERGES
jgi:hypothetical protein